MPFSLLQTLLLINLKNTPVLKYQKPCLTVFKRTYHNLKMPHCLLCSHKICSSSMTLKLNLFWELESLWAYIFYFCWIYTVCQSPLPFGFLLPKFQMARILTRQCWGQQLFWSSELAAQNRYHSFYKGNRGWRVLWNLGSGLKGNRAHEIWVTMPQVCAPPKT